MALFVAMSLPPAYLTHVGLTSSRCMCSYTSADGWMQMPLTPYRVATAAALLLIETSKFSRTMSLPLCLKPVCIVQNGMSYLLQLYYSRPFPHTLQRSTPLYVVIHHLFDDLKTSSWQISTPALVSSQHRSRMVIEYTVIDRQNLDYFPQELYITYI